MANPNDITVDSRDLSRLVATIEQYRQFSKKSFGEIIAHEAEQWRWELWGGQTKGKQTNAQVGFKTISPTPTKILLDAKSRGFRVKRKPNSITKATDGISWAADAAADSMLGGDKSDLFRVEQDANGIRVKPVRFSSRKSEKFLTGGRTGRKFADASKRAKDTSKEKIAETRAAVGNIKRLNKRALSVAIELSLRSRAAKGGTMALQWIGSNYKKRKSSTQKSGPVIVRSAQGIPLAVIEFTGGAETMGAKLSSLVPGTARQAMRHNIIGKVEAARVSDRMAYIEKKLAAAREKAAAKA